MANEKDYMDVFDFGFSLHPERTALILIDLQYASASRRAGLGSFLLSRGQAELGRYRFDRIETLVIPAVQRLLAFFREHRMPIIHVKIGANREDFADLPTSLRMLARAFNNRRGQREHDILDEVKPVEGEIVLTKTTIGAFESTGLDVILRTLGVSDLLFCGVSTDLCVESTARVAADRGYNCVLIEDGCACASQDRHDATMRTFGRFLGRVASSAAAIEELSEALGRRGRPRNCV